jgi:hypothetical protein
MARAHLPASDIASIWHNTIAAIIGRFRAPRYRGPVFRIAASVAVAARSRSPAVCDIIEVAATYAKHWQARQAVSIRFTVTSEWRAEWWRKSSGMQASFIRRSASSSPTWRVQPNPSTPSTTSAERRSDGSRKVSARSNGRGCRAAPSPQTPRLQLHAFAYNQALALDTRPRSDRGCSREDRR